jgi:hypothetical protein
MLLGHTLGEDRHGQRCGRGAKQCENYSTEPKMAHIAGEAGEALRTLDHKSTQVDVCRVKSIAALAAWGT